MPFDTETGLLWHSLHDLFVIVFIPEWIQAFPLDVIKSKKLLPVISEYGEPRDHSFLFPAGGGGGMQEWCRKQRNIWSSLEECLKASYIGMFPYWTCYPGFSISATPSPLTHIWWWNGSFEMCILEWYFTSASFACIGHVDLHLGFFSL